MRTMAFVHLGIVYFLWGTTFLAIRVAVREGSGFAPFIMAGTRVLIASAILFAIARIAKQRLRPTKAELFVVAAAGLLLWTGANGLVTWSEQRVHSGPAALVIATMPIWASLINAYLDRSTPSLLLFASLGVGLVKSEVHVVDRFWSMLPGRRRRQVLVDRIETAYAVRAVQFHPRAPGRDQRVRPATPADLDPLVVAARESLREERRPDPFAGDAKSFRRWVRGRVDRACVVETGARIGFAAYADVRRPEGWLLQGVYTWPEMRRRGLATAGVSRLCGDAFAAGADHVQLSVVDGNLAGRRLYEGLGFEPFAKLRTILFT